MIKTGTAVLIGKLADGRIVQVLKEKTSVAFSEYQHVLVTNKLTTNPRKMEPFWVISTLVVWLKEF